MHDVNLVHRCTWGPYMPSGPGINSPASNQFLQELAEVFVIVDGSKVTILLALSCALTIANSTFKKYFDDLNLPSIISTFLLS